MNGRLARLVPAVVFCLLAAPAGAFAATIQNIPVSCEATASGSGFLTGITRNVGNTVIFDYTTVGDRATGSLRVGIVGSVDPPFTDFVDGADNYGIGKVYGFRIGRVYDENSHFETREGMRLPVGNYNAPYPLVEKTEFLGQGMPTGIHALKMGTRTWSGSSGAWCAGGYEGTGWTVTAGSPTFTGKNQVIAMALVTYQRVSSSQTNISVYEVVRTPYYTARRSSTEYQDITTVDPYFSLQTVGTGSWGLKPVWAWPNLTTLDDPYVGSTMYATGYVRQSVACQTSESSATLTAWKNDVDDPSAWADTIRPREPGESDDSTSSGDPSLTALPGWASGFQDQLAGMFSGLDDFLAPLGLFHDLWSDE